MTKSPNINRKYKCQLSSCTMLYNCMNHQTDRTELKKKNHMYFECASGYVYGILICFQMRKYCSL